MVAYLMFSTCLLKRKTDSYRTKCKYLSWYENKRSQVSEFCRPGRKKKIPFTNVFFLFTKSYTIKSLWVTGSLRERQTGPLCPENRPLMYQQYSKIHGPPLLVHAVLCDSYSAPPQFSSLMNTSTSPLEIWKSCLGPLVWFWSCFSNAIRRLRPQSKVPGMALFHGALRQSCETKCTPAWSWFARPSRQAPK